MAEIRFGTDGWRAVIAEDFTFDNVRICAQAVADYVKARGLADRGMIIGYDTRFHSENFGAAVAEVFAGNGIVAYLATEAIPTPTTSYSILHRKAAGGIIITASHNPPIYSGFKYRPEYAGAASPDITAEVERRLCAVQAGDCAVKRLALPEAKVKGLIIDLDAKTPYLAQMARLVDVNAIKDADLTVVVDSMFGAGIGYFPALLSGGKIKIIEINNQRNPLFPGMNNPEPIAHNLQALVKGVAAHRADIGIANDGDADRIGVVDEKGNFINQLQVYALLMLYLLEVRQQRGPIIKTVTSTIMADKLAKIYNIPVYETQVGFKYVGPKMLEVNAIMGGEESGGYAFAGNVPERDGILAGLYLLDFMVKTGKTPSQLIEHLFSLVGPHYYERWDISFPPEKRGEVVEKVSSEQPTRVAGLKVVKTDTVDGFRYWLEDGGWLLIRFSGTEPIIRVYVETTHQDKVEPILCGGVELAGLSDELAAQRGHV